MTDAAVITAVAGGLALLVGVCVKAYLTIRADQRLSREAAELAAKTAAENKAAVEKVHKIVNSRDTAQRRELKELNARIAVLMERLGAQERRKPARKKPPVKRKRKR